MGHGGWVNDMESFLGKEGVVVRLLERSIRVSVGSKEYVWNPTMLELVRRTKRLEVGQRVSLFFVFFICFLPYFFSFLPPFHLKVCLVTDFASISDAEDGPMKEGDWGILKEDDQSGKPYRVKAKSGDGKGRTWWYDLEALQEYEGEVGEEEKEKEKKRKEKKEREKDSKTENDTATEAQVFFLFPSSILAFSTITFPPSTARRNFSNWRKGKS